MQLGFVGVGNIGTPMCRHLIEAGHTVLAYDVSANHLARIVKFRGTGDRKPTSGGSSVRHRLQFAARTAGN
jgi:3-hydroxyisobutyrate dehydrogenase-like beta-hydroxyacid dehydrogenase